MSFKPQVIADRSGQWSENSLRFATQEEAEASAADLASRWLLVIAHRAVPSDDPVNYAWKDGQLVSVEPPVAPPPRESLPVGAASA